MPAKLVWRPQAQEDFIEIGVTIAQNNPLAADRLMAAIEAKISALPAFPRVGPRRRDIRRSMRMLVEGRYLILYEIHPDRDRGRVDQIEIVRIVNGRRDLAGLF